MEAIIQKNERCFIGLPSCGYGFESAKLCFVACPSDDRYSLHLEAIKQVVEERQYECHIALKKIDPGNFAFCTKICSKIIQSQFCIVLLDPSITKKDEKFPNPNVHLEYGMMMSQNKHIIPFQHENYNLAFNISPLDTIKYSDSNFKAKMTEAVDFAIERFSKEKISGQVPPGLEFFTYYNLLGFKMSDVSLKLQSYLYKFGYHMGFFLFEKLNEYKFIGIFEKDDPKKAVLHTRLLIENIVSEYERLCLIDKMQASEGDYDYLIKNISIDIVVSPFFDKEEIKERIIDLNKSDYNYPLTVHFRSDFKEKVEGEYDKIKDFKAIKSPA